MLFRTQPQNALLTSSSFSCKTISLKFDSVLAMFRGLHDRNQAGDFCHGRQVCYRTRSCKQWSNYSFLAQNAASQTDLTGLIQLQGLTHLPGQYSDSPLLSSGLIDFYRDIPKDIIKKLYKIYFVDFLLFGYSIDEFLQE